MTVSPIQKRGDGEYRSRSSPNAAPPFKRPRGRPPKDRAHEICLPAIIPSSTATDVNVDESSQSTTILRPSSSNLGAMRSAPRADHTASGADVQKLRHGTKRKCNILQEAPIGLQQLAHTNTAQAEVTLEEVEQQCPRYIICLKASLQAVESFEDGDSDSDSEVMTYYTDTDSETEPGEEFDGTALRNDEAHETAHPMDTTTSLDKSPADVEFSHVTEDASSSHQAQAIEKYSKVTEEREISDKPEVSGFAEAEMQQTPTMVSLKPDITQISGHPENSNIRDHIRGLSQPLETIQSSEHPKPFDTTEMIQKAQEDRLWTPLIQPPEQGNTKNKIGDEETLYLPSIAARMSSDVNMAEWCNQQQNVSPAANISKELKQLYPPGSFILTQDPHSATNAFITTALPSFLDDAGPPQPEYELLSDADNVEECRWQQNVAPAASIAKELKQLYPPGSFILTQNPHSATNAFIATDLPSIFDKTGPLQSSNELPSSGQKPGIAISILTDKPPPFPPFLEPRCFPSPPDIVLPPTAVSSTSHARRPRTHPISTSLSSHASRQDTMGGNPKTKTSLELAAFKTAIGSQSRKGPSWKPRPSFQNSLTSVLVFGRGDKEIATMGLRRGLAGFLYRRDLITLVPHVEHLGHKIINGYLNCLTQYSNARRGDNSITMIGSTDYIQRGLLKRLAGFSTIYVPIIVRTHWLLAVLYPASLGAKGRVEVYDSHSNSTETTITASDALQFVKSRLAHEFNPSDWILTSLFSQPQKNDADSGLYLLANAKSIALRLAMVHLGSDAQRMDLRWQIAQELVTRSIVGGF
ncbi:hypothetical protein V501_01708 [Pseudogymnoascus sp. VKM F-4519 (FW-2642)]|nr:hypothetical protein V501_01708 [Pseudogymnoascus sp. VKM F-4519 (FW-2642)]